MTVIPPTERTLSVNIIIQQGTSVKQKSFDRRKTMENLLELERVLTDLELLADTFTALNIANQNEMFLLPDGALAIPAEELQKHVSCAKKLHAALLKQAV